MTNQVLLITSFTTPYSFKGNIYWGKRYAQRFLGCVRIRVSCHSCGKISRICVQRRRRKSFAKKYRRNSDKLGSSWVLLHIEPSTLRRSSAATDKLITQAESHRDWWHSLYDVFHPPSLRLESRKPLWRWRDLSRWREDWQSATVVNSTLVVDPTIRLPSFDLHRRQWSLLNRFRTGQGHCNACHKKWVSPTTN